MLKDIYGNPVTLGTYLLASRTGGKLSLYKVVKLNKTSIGIKNAYKINPATLLVYPSNTYVLPPEELLRIKLSGELKQ